MLRVRLSGRGRRGRYGGCGEEVCGRAGDEGVQGLLHHITQPHAVTGVCFPSQSNLAQ